MCWFEIANVILRSERRLLKDPRPQPSPSALLPPVQGAKAFDPFERMRKEQQADNARLAEKTKADEEERARMHKLCE